MMKKKIENYKMAVRIYIPTKRRRVNVGFTKAVTSALLVFGKKCKKYEKCSKYHSEPPL